MSVPVVYRAKPKDWRQVSEESRFLLDQPRPEAFRQIKQIHWKKHVVSSKDIAAFPRCQVTAIKKRLGKILFLFYTLQ